MSSMLPSARDMWFLPLGGTGEIGMNVNLYGHHQSWIMVDCGQTFDVPLERSNDHDKHAERHPRVSADLSFIESRRSQLVGLVLTHAHEDHIGAVLDVWEQLQCPIYATKFTLEVLQRKAYRREIAVDLPLVLVDVGSELDIGPFTIKWLSITHSIPEANALLISTPVARLLHTGDWKIDHDPVIGSGFNQSIFKQLAHQKLDAVICDSTNATKPGYSLSEKACERGLGEYISKAQGRVVITCFASNVARLITIARITMALDKHLCVLGPAIETMISTARRCGYWPDELKVTPKRFIGYLPKHQVVIIATGSQGEPRASLSKLALDTHKDCQLDEDDTVLFSSIVIPGNEKPVEKLTKQLSARNIKVVHSESSEFTIHASGHPNQQDLFDMFTWTKSKCVVPVHGEPLHLAACAEIANLAKVPNQLLGLNGDLYSFAPRLSIKRNAIKAGRVVL